MLKPHFLLGNILCILLLTSCGFHLRGAVDLPKPLQRVYLRTPNPYSELTHDLQQSLKLSGAQVVKTPMEASTILHIQKENVGQQLLSVGGTQQTRQYNLILTVTFAILDNQNKTLVPTQNITETRTITIQSNQVLAGSNEANNIYQQMRRTLTYNMMNQLSSTATRELLNNQAK